MSQGNLIDLGGLFDARKNELAYAREQQDLMNRLYQSPVINKTPLTECLDYFRRLGLTDEQIRKAITPALFKALPRD